MRECERVSVRVGEEGETLIGVGCSKRKGSKRKRGEWRVSGEEYDRVIGRGSMREQDGEGERRKE